MAHGIASGSPACEGRFGVAAVSSACCQLVASQERREVFCVSSARPAWARLLWPPYRTSAHRASSRRLW
eukprot:7531802-Alexandrium_andersonii.AAC.1